MRNPSSWPQSGMNWLWCYVTTQDRTVRVLHDPGVSIMRPGKYALFYKEVSFTSNNQADAFLEPTVVRLGDQIPICQRKNPQTKKYCKSYYYEARVLILRSSIQVKRTPAKTSQLRKRKRRTIADRLNSPSNDAAVLLFDRASCYFSTVIQNQLAKLVS